MIELTTNQVIGYGLMIVGVTIILVSIIAAVVASRSRSNKEEQQRRNVLGQLRRTVFADLHGNPGLKLRVERIEKELDLKPLKKEDVPLKYDDGWF